MGGLEKCLIDLCNHIDYEKYSVDLYLFNDGRDLLPQLNKNVNLLPDSPYYSFVFNFPFLKSLKCLFENKQYSLLFYRIVRFIKSRLHINNFSEFDWKMMKKTMLKIEDSYDSAIGFEEETSCYYVAECINAEFKSGWIHTDLKAIDTNRNLDRKAFSKLNHICTVSQNSLNSLKELYPEFKNKYKLFSMPALFNYDKIEEMAKEEVNFDKDYINIVSVGRLVELKGFHLCVKPLRRLIDENYKVRWYVAGEGPYREFIERLIFENNLEDSFILLGNQINPYKYIYNSDFCVQPSSYEGLSLVLAEELYLKKPVIATNIPGNTQLIANKVNGLIINRTEEDIYDTVKLLIDDDELFQFLKKSEINLFDKEETLKQLEVILNEK